MDAEGRFCEFIVIFYNEFCSIDYFEEDKLHGAKVD